MQSERCLIVVCKTNDDRAKQQLDSPGTFLANSVCGDGLA